MFPYPSGAGLHVGHPEGYTATDIMSRYYRMKDYDVLHPMGWDAFGLPAEQFAMKTGTHPAVTTYKNIATFKRQLKSLGFSYDWTRELSTTDEDYYKWTQWLFLQLYKAGLAAQSEVSVNWCPMLGTTLANEEIINGLSERGDHPVVRKPLRQWVFKITQYADKLEEDLKLCNWPEGTLTAQKGWIGRSVGASITFNLAGLSDTVSVFTTRPDTVMGVTYVVLAPEHPLVEGLTTTGQQEEVAAYKAKVASKSDMERTAIGKDKGKTGVFLGSYAIHPITGENVPVWIADYVLAGYGTGAVMAVPAHDERDFEFATIFDLPIKAVVKASSEAETPTSVTAAMTGEGVTCNSGDDLDGLSTTSSMAKVIEKLTALGMGSEQVTYKLRDWVFSRQRYWGEPIPIYFPVQMLTADGLGSPKESDPKDYKIMYDQPIPVPESELPLKLPEMSDFHPGDDPQGCLARATEWRFFQQDNKWFARETNTMPQWAGSCWYYLRFTDPKNTEAIFSPEAESWLPVDLYVGGQEHAVLHLLYARFWHKVLYDLKIVKTKEPFMKLVHQGMILGADNEKMSKSKGNVINPDDIVQEFGADALRLYEMFMGPLEAMKPWQTGQLMGVVRFRDKVLSVVQGASLREEPIDPKIANPKQLALLKEMHKTIKKVTEDIDSMAFNTGISAMMIYTNALLDAMKDPSMVLSKELVESLVLLVSPYAPHVAEECWQLLGHTESLAYHPWPVYDEELCVQSTAVIAVQVNGKVRGKIEVDVDAEQESVMGVARGNPNVLSYLENKELKKVIYIPGRILNIVTA
jgi:leucyl-tRNA synthetase